MNRRGRAIMSHRTQRLHSSGTLREVLSFVGELEKREHNEALAYVKAMTDEQLADMLAYVHGGFDVLVLMGQLLAATALDRFQFTKDDVRMTLLGPAGQTARKNAQEVVDMLRTVAVP